MPQNKKQAVLFTLLMCSLMVFGMSSYNFIVAAGHFHLPAILSGYLPGFIVALILDVIIVGPIAKKIAFKLPFNRHSKWQTILAVTGCMVIGMVSFMSLYGLIYNRAPITLQSYAIAWITNFVMAAPLNLLVVGPISRFILQQVQNKN